MSDKHLPKCQSCNRYRQYKPDTSCTNLEHWQYYRKRLDAEKMRKQQVRDTLKGWSKHD